MRPASVLKVFQSDSCRYSKFQSLANATLLNSVFFAKRLAIDNMYECKHGFSMQVADTHEEAVSPYLSSL